MKDVLFYDFDFNCLGDFSGFISLNIEKNYCGYGTAELHFSLAETDIITILEDNAYTFFVAGEDAVIVTGWKIGEDIAIFGRTPEWLLTKRGVEPFSCSDATAEDIARQIVTLAAGDFVALGELSGARIKQSYSIDNVKVLYDVICDILKSQNMGFRVILDIASKQFVFSVYQGQESLCLISTSNRTGYDMAYTVEKQNMATNSGWYERKFIDMGGWDAYNNTPPLSDNNAQNAYTYYRITSESYYQSGDKKYPVERFGFDCAKDTYLYSDSPDGKWKVTKVKPDTIWIYLDNSPEKGAKRWDSVLPGIKTEDEALAEIALLNINEKSEVETKSIEYKKDYCLGDIVRVQLEFGEFKKSEKKRVASVNIYYDEDKTGVVPILSNVEE